MKKAPEKPAEAENSAPPKKRRILRRIFRNFCLLLLLLLLACAGFAYWVCQTASGQTWLVATLNDILKADPQKPGLSFKITSLRGSLPFNFEAGLESSDGSGVWLTAPKNTFALNWAQLPKTLHIAALKIADADISRLPAMPPDNAPKEPSPPYTIKDFRSLLTQIADFLAQKHWWLPDVILEGIAVRNALLPGELLPQKDNARVSLNASLGGAFKNSVLSLRLEADAQNHSGARLELAQFGLNRASLALDVKAGHAPDGLDANAGLSLALLEPALAMADIPADYLGHEAKLDLELNARAQTSAKNGAAQITLKGPSLAAGHASLDISGSWQTGPGWQKDEIDGPLRLNLNCALRPVQTDSFLGMIRQPASLSVVLQGDLPKIKADVALACADIASGAHTLRDLRLTLASRELDIPLSDQALAALENENQIEISLEGALDGNSIDLAGEAFVQALDWHDATGEKVAAWRAGLRKLRLNALAATLQGDVAAILPPAASPALDGSLRLAIAKWDKIDHFVPGQKLSGSIEADITLNSGLGNDPAAPLAHDGAPLTQPRQTITANVDANSLAMRPAAGGEGFGLGRLNLRAQALDPFSRLTFSAALDAASIRAAGMALGAKLKADGALAGPISADLETSGDVRSKIAAQWQPGVATLRALKVEMNSAALLKGKKGATLGVALLKPANISYGDKGIAVDALDIDLVPSGRLRAHGGVAPDKLNFSLALEKLSFRPWQAVIPQMPSGSCAIAAHLTGTPQRPAGNFRLSVADLTMPGSPLGPVGLTLAGRVENSGASSSLAARLEVDPKTLKTLGASNSEITARIPLLFGPDGVPKPDMKGNLAAKVRWNGALGPIWNLLPMPDQRLNGRVAIDIDAAGAMDAPKIRGGVKIDRGRYENLSFGVLLTDINMRLDLSDKGGKIGSGGLPGSMALALSLSDGRGGSVNVNGNGALDGANLDISAKIDHLKPLRRRDIHVELSGTAKVTGAAQAPDINGQITVNRGEVLLNNIDFAGSVTTLDITTPQEEAKAQAAAPEKAKGGGSLNVRIVMLPRFTVEGRGLASIWQANLLVSGTLADPRITGQIDSVSGNFDFLGKNFALSKGQVTFAGGSLSNPLLDVELTNETPDLTANILITGPVNKMRMRLTSDPSLPRDDILSRVLFGRSINDLSRLEQLQLAAAVAQLAGFGSGGGGVLDFAKKTLGVDVLRIGTSSSDAAGDGDEGAGGTTVEMGKYINDKIYMGVQQGMSGDSTAFIIQLEITPRTSMEIRSEQNNTWGGMNWKYNY